MTLGIALIVIGALPILALLAVLYVKDRDFFFTLMITLGIVVAVIMILVGITMLAPS